MISGRWRFQHITTLDGGRADLGRPSSLDQRFSSGLGVMYLPEQFSGR